MKVHFSMAVREHDDGRFDVRTLTHTGKESIYPVDGIVGGLAYINAVTESVVKHAAELVKEVGKK